MYHFYIIFIISFSFREDFLAYGYPRFPSECFYFNNTEGNIASLVGTRERLGGNWKQIGTEHFRCSRLLQTIPDLSYTPECMKQQWSQISNIKRLRILEISKKLETLEIREQNVKDRIINEAKIKDT
jgi:hypothetical protein